jgi:hypothetical protein
MGMIRYDHIKPAATPEIIHDDGPTALIDGHRCYGQAERRAALTALAGEFSWPSLRARRGRAGFEGAAGSRRCREAS